NNAGIKAEDLDLILVATVTPDTPFPSVSCMLQERLGATKAAAVDLGAACAGFMYAMITGQQYIETGAYKNILIVGVDKLSKIIDRTGCNTCVLLGDGARAGVLGIVSDHKGILSFELSANGAGGKGLFQNDAGYLEMPGRDVNKFA